MQEDRQYQRRIGIAITVSLLAHALLFVGGLRWTPASMGEGATPDYVVVEFEPELSSPARQLVETVTPSDTPPEDARYIARANTQAADTILREGDQPGPINEVESPEERLGTPGAAPLALPATPPLASPEPSMPQAEPEQEREEMKETEEEQAQEKAEEQPEELPAPPKPAPDSEPSAEPAAKRQRVAAVQETMREQTPSRAAISKSTEAPPAPTAQARPAIAAPPAPATPPRGRMNNGVMTKGFTSYAAIEDEIAPYLEQVKKKVELRWREALLLQYSGSQPRDVEVDCEIAKDGSLVSVKLAAPSEDRVYGQLCLDAIRKAAPFAAFPFEVPDIYRNQNLEIRWHFSFL